MKKNNINATEIFNKFHKYTYNDIKGIDEVIVVLFQNAIKEPVCLSTLASEGLFTYMTSVLEYVSYNNIPVKLKFDVDAILADADIVNDSTIKVTSYFTKNNVTYRRIYTITISENTVDSINISSINFATGNKFKPFD